MINKKEIEFYKNNGYLLKKNFIESNLIDSLKYDFHNIHERMNENCPKDVKIGWENNNDSNGKKIICQLINSELVSSTISEIARSNKILNVIEKIMSPNISLLHSKFLPKEPRVGKGTPWHQDFAYWKTKTNKAMMTNCQLAIDPMTHQNGCLHFIPGSHLGGLKNHLKQKYSFENSGNSFSLTLPDKLVNKKKMISIQMEPGDTVFFSCLLFHGTGPNNSNKSRWANTFAYNITDNDSLQFREILR